MQQTWTGGAAVCQMGCMPDVRAIGAAISEVSAMPLEERRRLLSENDALRAELRHARDELRGLLAEATSDELTGLLNRRGFLRIAGEEMHIARAGGRGLTLIYIDVDGLKSVNDCY